MEEVEWTGEWEEESGEDYGEFENDDKFRVDAT